MASDALRFLASEQGASIQFPLNPKCVLDKEGSIKQYVSYMLDRTNKMFEYDGLPDTIPDYMLELYLQIFGYAAFVKVDKLRPIPGPTGLDFKPGVYIFFGGIGGERDMYYRPRMFVCANPRLEGSVNCTILYDNESAEGANNPCVLMRNDTNYCGLLPLFNRYAAELTENDISVRCAQINARALSAIEASSDRDAESARKYLDDLEAGKLAIIGETAFLDGIRVTNMTTQSSNTIIQLIELQQYLKASWYNELGLNVNFNMKREYMSEEEIAVNTDILLPLVDDMLECRQKACELINSTFGLNVSVKKSSAWANKEQEELSALAEAAAQGGISLKETISNKIEGGDEIPGEGSVDETEKSSVQPEVQEVQGEPDKGAEMAGDIGRESVGGSEEAPAGDVAEVAPDVTINVNVNVNGGEVDESETPEESEKSDDL